MTISHYAMVGKEPEPMERRLVFIWDLHWIEQQMLGQLW